MIWSTTQQVKKSILKGKKKRFASQVELNGPLNDEGKGTALFIICHNGLDPAAVPCQSRVQLKLKSRRFKEK